MSISEHRNDTESHLPDVASLQDAISETKKKLENARAAMGMELSRRIVAQKRAGEPRRDHIDTEEEKEFLRLQALLQELQAKFQGAMQGSQAPEMQSKSPDAAA